MAISQITGDFCFPTFFFTIFAFFTIYVSPFQSGENNKVIRKWPKITSGVSYGCYYRWVYITRNSVVLVTNVANYIKFDSTGILNFSFMESS